MLRADRLAWRAARSARACRVTLAASLPEAVLVNIHWHKGRDGRRNPTKQATEVAKRGGRGRDARRDQHSPDGQASKQASKQASEQASKQAGEQAGRASKQASEQASKQASEQASKRASKRVSKRVSKRASKEVRRLASLLGGGACSCGPTVSRAARRSMKALDGLAEERVDGGTRCSRRGR